MESTKDDETGGENDTSPLSLGAAELESSEGSTAERRRSTPGIVYLSRVPPFMKPRKVRHIFSQFGSVGRIYLQPEDPFIQKRRKKFGGNKKRNYTEGWVEFGDKRVAKAVAMAMNNNPVGGKKKSYYHDDLWNLKYLSKFRWTHLTEKIAYEQAVREQKMRTEISQAKRENTHYLQNVDKRKEIEAIVERKRKKGVSEEELGHADRRTFKQRKIIDSSTVEFQEESVTWSEASGFKKWRTAEFESKEKGTHERRFKGVGNDSKVSPSLHTRTPAIRSLSSEGGDHRVDKAVSGNSLAKVKLSDAILRKILPRTA